MKCLNNTVGYQDQFFNDGLTVSSLQSLAIDDYLHSCSVRKWRISHRNLPFIPTVAASSSTRHFAKRSKFRLEHFGNLLVGGRCSNETDEFFQSITSTHVQGEETAILAADRSSRTLQLHRVVIPDRAIASDERLYRGNKRGNP